MSSHHVDFVASVLNRLQEEINDLSRLRDEIHRVMRNFLEVRDKLIDELDKFNALDKFYKTDDPDS